MEVERYHGRARSASLTLVLALGSSACLERSDLRLPEAPAGTKGVLFVVSEADGRDTISGDRLPFAYATEYPATLHEPWTLVPGARVTLLFYDRTPAELGLTPDVFIDPVRSHDPAAARPLPAPMAAYAAPAEAETTWRPIGAGELPDFRLPPFLPEDCTTAHGCPVARGSGTEDFRCAIPCPAPDLVAAPELPRPIELPRETPCPSGWSWTAPTALGGRGCVPPTLTATCASGLAVFFDAPRCASATSPCTADDFGDDVPAGALFVKPDAAPGGDGSRAAPLRTLAEAIQRGPASVALARATFVEDATITGDLELLGACGESVLAGDVTVAEGARLHLSNLTLGTADHPARLGSVGHLDLDHTTVVGAVELRAASTATISRVFVDARGALGAALLVDSSDLTASDLSIEGGAAEGLVVVGGGARADLTRPIVRSALGAGVRVSSGGSLSAAELAVIGAGHGGVVAAEHGRVTLDRAFITDCGGVDWEAGLSASVGSEAHVARSVFRRNLRFDLVVTSSATATVEDSLFFDSPAVARDASVGVAEGVLELTRVQVSGYHAAGVEAFAGALTARDLGVCDCVDEGDGCPAGVLVEGGRAILARVAALRPGHVGVLAARSAQRPGVDDLVAEDVDVDGVSVGPMGSVYAGVAVSLLAKATLHRVRVRGGGAGSVVGIDLNREAAVRLTDATIRDVAEGGLRIRNTSSVTASRVDIVNVTGPGVGAGTDFGLPATWFDLSDIRVESVHPGHDYPPSGFGTVLTVDGRLERFSISDVDGAAMSLGQPSIRVSNGRIDRSITGVAIVGDTIEPLDVLLRVSIGRDTSTPFVRL